MQKLCYFWWGLDGTLLAHYWLTQLVSFRQHWIGHCDLHITSVILYPWHNSIYSIQLCQIPTFTGNWLTMNALRTSSFWQIVPQISILSKMQKLILIENVVETKANKVKTRSSLRWKNVLYKMHRWCVTISYMILTGRTKEQSARNRNDNQESFQLIILMTWLWAMFDATLQ